MQTFSIDGTAAKAAETDQIVIHSNDRRTSSTGRPYYMATITWGAITFTGRIGIDGNSLCSIHVPYTSDMARNHADWGEVQSTHSGDVMFRPCVSITSERELYDLRKAAAAWYWQQEQALAERQAQHAAHQRAAITGGMR